MAEFRCARCSAIITVEDARREDQVACANCSAREEDSTVTSKTSPQRSPALPANAAPLAAAPSSAAKGSENRGEPPIYRLFFILGVLLIAVGTMSCIVGLVALMFGDSKMLPLAICGTLAAAAGGTLHLLRNLGMDMGW